MNYDIDKELKEINKVIITLINNPFDWYLTYRTEEYVNIIKNNLNRLLMRIDNKK